MPFCLCISKTGIAALDLDEEMTSMDPLFETIIKYIPAPENRDDEPFKLLISTIDYNDYVGRIGIGKIEQGIIKENDKLVRVNKFYKTWFKESIKIAQIYEFEGLNRVEVDSSRSGSIVAVTGIEDINIGDTITSQLKTLKVLNLLKFLSQQFPWTFQ